MSALLHVARLLLAVLAFAAIGRQLSLHIAASFSTLNFFSYFTNLSNLFAAIVLLLSVFAHPRKSSALDIMRYLSAVNMAVVGIVYVLLLRDVDLGALLPWINFVLHYLMPGAVILDYLLQPPGTERKGSYIALTLAFPAVYLVYTLLRGAMTGWYPYPFLNPAHVGGYQGVALYSAGIFGAFIVLAGSLRVAGNRLAVFTSGKNADT